uniref:phospholipase n=3 Tax=Aggregatibacter actinomycetemcomitans TaxID=714 RepID=UPI000D6529EC
IQKALEGVKVRILVWSMWGNIQTFKEANLGNRPGVFKGREKGVTDAQAGYDRWWFEAIRGNLDEVIVNNRAEGVIHVWNVDEIEKHKKLTEFTKSPKRTNLVYKNRHVEKQKSNYKDKTLPEEAQRIHQHNFKDTTLPDGSYNFALKYAPSHHQKTVLIDYDKPEIAVGFVLEHNMVDNYWDTDEHSLKTTAPNRGKNSPTPLQDVSGIVTGRVLWDINHNFCQSWDRENNKQWGDDEVETNLMVKRKGFTREHYSYENNLWKEAWRSWRKLCAPMTNRILKIL